MPKKEPQNLDQHQTFRLTTFEKIKLQKFAKNHGKSVTEVLRGLVRSLDTKGTQKDLINAYRYSRGIDETLKAISKSNQVTLAADKTMLFYLNNFANNINQIAKWANTYKSEADAQTVISALQGLVKTADFMRTDVKQLLTDKKLEERKILKEGVNGVYHEVFKPQKQQGAD